MLARPTFTECGLTDSDTSINGTTLAGGGGICGPGNGGAPAGGRVDTTLEAGVGERGRSSILWLNNNILDMLWV